MKYLKTFESYREDPKFFRFSHVDLLGEKDQTEFTPMERKMIGPDEYNDALVALGFPNKNKCIHMMNETAFDPSYSTLYGKNIYNISIDDESKIGWSFFFPVNDWYFKGFPFHKASQENKDIQEFEDRTEFGSFEYENKNSKKKILRVTKLVVENGFIGTGTLKDLMSAKFWGSEKVFVWTNDKVIVSKYKKETKVGNPGTYKKEQVITSEDFSERGIEKSQIGQFYQSSQGKKMATIKTLNPELKREESLRLLDEWIKEMI